MNYLNQFGFDQINDVKKATYLSAKQLEKGLCVNVVDEQILLAQGTHLTGVVIDCEMLDGSTFLITLATGGLRVPAILANGVTVNAGDFVRVTDGIINPLETGDTGVLYVSEIDENYQDSKGNQTRAAFLELK